MYLRSKQEILQALARTAEEKVLLASLIDKEQTCVSRGYLTHTRFLDLNERALCAEAVRLLGASDHALLWGGWEDAERAVCLFYPDYLDAESAKAAAPIALLRAHKHAEDALTHRDYLGALMGLQIDRGVVGDILVHEEGADLLVLEDMADFLLAHFDRAGRKRIELTREDAGNVKQAQTVETKGQGSVASPRLDSVTALIFGLPRAEAQARIAKGLVFLNNAPCLKPERQIEPGDRLTVRGVGRAHVTCFGGTSRKGRTFVNYVKSF